MNLLQTVKIDISRGDIQIFSIFVEKENWKARDRSVDNWELVISFVNYHRKTTDFCRRMWENSYRFSVCDLDQGE